MLDAFKTNGSSPPPTSLRRWRRGHQGGVLRWTLVRAFHVLGRPLEKRTPDRRRLPGQQRIPLAEKVPGGSDYVFETATELTDSAPRSSTPTTAAAPKTWSF